MCGESAMIETDKPKQNTNFVTLTMKNSRDTRHIWSHSIRMLFRFLLLITINSDGAGIDEKRPGQFAWMTYSYCLFMCVTHHRLAIPVLNIAIRKYLCLISVTSHEGHGVSNITDKAKMFVQKLALANNAENTKVPHPWYFARGIHQRPVYFPSQRGTWRRHQMDHLLRTICARNSQVTGEFPTQRSVTRSFDFSLICAWMDGWVNNREAGDLRRHRAYYDVTVLSTAESASMSWCHQICCLRRATVSNLKQQHHK